MHDNGRREISRRSLLASAAALAAPIALPSSARAQSNQVVVGTWGGDYARLLHENIDVAVLAPEGITVTQDIGDGAPRAAKIQVQRRMPRGSLDVGCFMATEVLQFSKTDALEPLDSAKIPNLAHVPQYLRSPTAVPQIISPQVLIYNPSRVPNPPTSFGDLLDPRYKGKVGMGDGNYPYVMMAAALYGSGNPNDLEKAKEVAVKLNENGLRLYASVDSIATAFKSGELDVGIIWLARVIMWQNAGVEVKASFPKEGCVLYVSSMVVPKNAPNQDGAMKYINAMLEPAAQRGFAEKMGYMPSIDNAGLTGKVAEQLALPNPPPKLVVPDYVAMAATQSEVGDWWKKTIDHS